MIGKMPGDNWRKFASLRTLYSYMMAHPGSKLLFMGCEFGQFIEWRFKEQLEWFMLEHEQHSQLKEFVKVLNHLYLKQKSFWEQNQSWDGFSWHSADDTENSIFIFSRISKKPVISTNSNEPNLSEQPESVLVVLNMMPSPVDKYRIGVSEKGDYEVILDSDSKEFGGSGFLSISYPIPIFKSVREGFGGFPYFIELPIPPLSALYLKKL